MTASLPHPGQRTPSGQRCWRTSAKHLASSNSSERLTRSDEGMTARAPCATAAADQPPASSQQKPHATATRSPASQHPGSQQEPQEFAAGRAALADANNFLYLIRANQLAGADPSRIRTPTLLVYSPADLVFPQSWIERTAAALREVGTPVEMVPLPGPNGHLNGLLHITQAGPRIAAFLARE